MRSFGAASRSSVCYRQLCRGPVKSARAPKENANNRCNTGNIIVIGYLRRWPQIEAPIPVKNALSERPASPAPHPGRFVDVDVRPDLPAYRVGHVIAHPWVRERIGDAVDRQPPWGVGDYQLGHPVELFGSLG